MENKCCKKSYKIRYAFGTWRIIVQRLPHTQIFLECSWLLTIEVRNDDRRTEK